MVYLNGNRSEFWLSVQHVSDGVDVTGARLLSLIGNHLAVARVQCNADLKKISALGEFHEASTPNLELPKNDGI